MQFGSNENYNRIKKAIVASDTTIFDDVFRIIDSDLAFMKRYPDISNVFDDIMQEIKLSIWKNINRYISNSENKHPNQRNAWLLKVAYYKMCDHFRKHNKKIDEITDSEWHIFKGELKSRFDDFIDPNLVVENVLVANYDQSQMRTNIFEIIKNVCCLNNSPESIIVFFFNKIIIPLKKGTLSGSPRKVQEFLSGKTVVELFDILKQELEITLNCDIPSNVFIGLDSKINENPKYNEMVLCMDNNKISDISYRILNKVKDQANNNMEGI